MTLKVYLVIMSITTLLCWGSWGYVLASIDPTQSSWVGFVFFYGSLFLALVGSNALLTFAGYHFFCGRTLPLFRYVEYSFRDAVALSAVLLVLLYLQSQNFLHLWQVIFLPLIVFFIGAFIFSGRDGKPRKSTPTFRSS